VPLSYEADDPHGLPSLAIVRLPARSWHGSGFISIDFGKQPSPEAVEAAHVLLEEKGFNTGTKRTKVGELEATLAGRPGRCVEFNLQDDNTVVNALIAQNDIREIVCQFSGDVSASLLGSANLKRDFYEIIQTAETTQRKN
jgi:hypothetical protein